MGAASSLPGSPRAEQVVPARALSTLKDYGAARGLDFAPVSQARPLGLPANDAELVDSLEGELEQARTSLSALEEANASLRLHKVEAQLLAHPHLPQASFLMAECLALQAQAARAASSPGAAELEAERAALEGPRAPAFGETFPAPPVIAKVALEVQGLDVTDELELDGARARPGLSRVTLAPGLHHLRVWRGGRPIFATFTRVAPEQKALALGVPALVPCSVEDLERASRVSPSVPEPPTQPPLVACAKWARVREDGAGIAVSLCQHGRCGAFQHWQRREPATFAPISVERQRFPTWAGFALAGGAALLASGVVLWQSGAFERGHASAATWEYDGLNPRALRF